MLGPYLDDGPVLRAARDARAQRSVNPRCFERAGENMRIRVGCEMTYQFGQATPMIVMLNVHASRVSDLEQPDYVITTPSVPLEGYRDSFGNWCNRLVAPSGPFSLRTDTVIQDSGQPAPSDVGAEQHPV